MKIPNLHQIALSLWGAILIALITYIIINIYHA